MAQEGKGLYEQLEDKYYDFLDWLESAGIPIYKIVDPIEEKNIPTFPLAVLLSLLVVVGVVALVLPLFFPAESELTIFVQDANGDPVGSATVNVSLADGQLVDTDLTDSSGSATIKAPRGKEIIVEALKEPDFLQASRSITLQEESESLAITIERRVAQLNKTIRLLKPGTNELVEEFVEVHFRCSNNSSFFESKSTTTGFIDLAIPSDCGLLQVEPQGGFSAQRDSFEATLQETIELFLEADVVGTGQVLVTVRDASANPLAGIRVNLLIQNASTGIGTIYLSGDTSASGIVAFNDVPEGKYFVTISDPTNTFAEFDSSTTGDVKSLAIDGSINFAIVLERTVVGAIKVLVKDKVTLEPIENALVTLSKDATPISSKETDGAGKAEFSVGEQVSYTVAVDRIGYLIETLQLEPKEGFFEVLLERATSTNSESLTVTVVDEVGEPVEDVRLTLRLAEDDSQVGSELVTGTNGVAVFQRVKEGSFYVSALKPGFGEATSPTTELNLRQQNTLQITLEIGFGNIELMVLDDTKQLLAGANASLVNFFTGEVLEQGVSGADGITSLSARADKTAFVVVTNPGFLPYTTIPISIGKDITHEVKVELKKETPILSLEYVGLSVGDKIVKDGTTTPLDSGQRYKARFLLLVPSGSAFEEAGVHIRTGQAQQGVTNIIEKDNLFILGVQAAFDEVMKGTSFTPPDGISTDAVHYTTGDAKWAEMIFNNPSHGVYEVEADLQVKENARQGTTLDLWYRAWGKSGSFLRFPADEVLGTNESTPQKQALYAQAKNKKFSVGPTNLCFEGFCTSIVVENVSEQVQTSVVDEFLAEVSSKYRLKFSVSSVSEEVFSGAELRIEDPAGAIEMGNYEITSVSGAKREGTAIGSRISVGVGDIRKNDIFSGIVDFQPKNDGLTTLKLQLFSGIGAKEKIFEKEILVNILPAQEMNVEIVPKIVVPFINNNLIVQVTNLEDETPIANALVTAKKNSTVIAQGQTNSDGIFPFTVLSPNAGSVISVLVEKRGFRPVQLEIQVTENILSSIPEEIRETLVIGEQPQKDIAVTFLNLTQIPLTINSIEPSSSFEELIEFDFDNSLVGSTLDVNGVVDSDIAISLTEQAESIQEPLTIEGSINLVVTNTEFAKSWNTAIPTEIRIGFGDEVDETDCLNLSQTEWELFTSTQEVKRLTVNLQNNCRSAGQAIALGSLQAKLNLGAENKVGEFRVTIEVGEQESGEPEEEVEEEANLQAKQKQVIYLQELEGITLSTVFKELVSSLPANSEATLTIEFKPDQVVSANQEISIDFRATHPTEHGVEYIRNKIGVKLNINDLAACISIVPKEQVRVRACPFNVGYNQFPNYFSGPYAYGGYPNQFGSGFGQTFGGGFGFGYDQYPDYYGSGAPGYYSGGPSYNQPPSPYYPEYGERYGLDRLYGGQNVQYGFNRGVGAGYLNDPNYRGFDPYQTQPGYKSGLPPYITADPEYATGGFRNYPPNYGGYSNRTYPFSNYNAPFYGGDSFDPAVGSRFGCGKAQLRVTNNCSAPVEVSFDTTEALQVDKPKLSLEKGKQETVNVRPTYFAGIYPIDVSAKLSSSDELPQKISEILVNVENDLTNSYRDCISINPPRKLKFNSFFGKPVTLQVINSCYDRGVRLLRSNNTIFFSSIGVRAPTDIIGSGPQEMVENWALLDEVIQSSGSGRTQQIQTFEIFKALRNYCDTLPHMPPIDSTTSPIATIGNLRYFFSQGYYSVKSNTNLIVNFYTDFGTRQSINFPMTLEDWWDALPFLDMLSGFGGAGGGGYGAVAGYSPAACINKDKLKFKGTSGECMTEAEFEALERKGYTTSAYTTPSKTADTDYRGPLLSVPTTGTGLMNIATPRRYLNTCEGYFGRFGYPNTLGARGGSVSGPFRRSPFDARPSPYYPNYLTPDIGASQVFDQRRFLPYYIQPTGRARDQRNYFPSYIDGRQARLTGSSLSYPKLVGVQGCGMLDSISDISPTVIEKNGIKIRLSIADKKDVKVDFDGTQWRKKGKPRVEFSETIIGTVRRVSPPSSEKFSIPFKFCVEKGEEDGVGPKPKPGEAEVCSNGGVTGDEAYNSFGFDKLKFDWRAEQISSNECDTENKNGIYCDATQFSISLNKKAQKISDVVEKVTPEKCKIEGESCDKNSKELYRHLTEYLSVTDSANEDAKYFFFKDADGDLIENTALKKKLSEKLSGLKEEIVVDDLNSSARRARVIDRTVDLLDDLAKEKEALNGEEILVLLKADEKTLAQKSGDKLKYEKEIEELGLSVKRKIGKGDPEFFIMAFKEFKEFYKNLQEAIKTEGERKCEGAENANCYVTKDGDNFTVVRVKEIKKGDNNGVQIDLTFLTDFKKALADGRVVIGIRSVKDIEEEKRKTVMEHTELGGYENFFEFYTKNIEFDSQLIEDGYSEDFKEDFESEYKKEKEEDQIIVGEFKEWKFSLKKEEKTIELQEDTTTQPASQPAEDGEPSTQPADTEEKRVDAGEYNVTLNYDWSTSENNPSIAVELEEKRKLSEVSENYARNPLFSFPVDGRVGLEDDGALHRTGYGVSLSPTLPQEFLRFNHYGDPEDDPFVYFTEKSTVKYENRFEPTNAGVILTLSKDNITFQPTDPIGMQVRIKKTTGKENNAGILYGLFDGTGLEETDIFEAENLIEWEFTKDEILGGKLGFEWDEQHQKKSLCGDEIDEYNGFVFTNGKKGETVIRTVIFVPTRYSNTVGNSILYIKCIEDSAGASKFVDPAAGKGGTPLDIGKNTLNSTNTNRLLDTYTVKKLVEMIKDDKKLVCADIINDKLTLRWNNDQILEKLK